MDSELRNDFPVGQYVTTEGKKAKNFFFFLDFFDFINLLFGRLTEICSKTKFQFRSVLRELQ